MHNNNINATLYEKYQTSLFHPPLPRTNPICPLITTYLPGLHCLRHILKRSHHILSDPSKDAISYPPNLSQLLVRTNFDPQLPHPIPGSYSCQRPPCKIYTIHPIVCSSRALSPAICSSRNLIYLHNCIQR